MGGCILDGWFPFVYGRGYSIVACFTVTACGAGSAVIGGLELDGEVPLAEEDAFVHVEFLFAGVDGVTDSAVSADAFGVVDVEEVEVALTVAEIGGGDCSFFLAEI